MRRNASLLALAGAVVALIFSSAHGQTTADDPTQLGARQIEVRTLDVSYDIAYRSATQALLSIGYSISHSDKASGILTGSRTVGVTEMREEVKRAKEEAKQYREQVRQEQAAKTLFGLLPYVGWLAPLVSGSRPPPEREITEPSRFEITMLLQPLSDKQTQIRFKMQKDGEAVWDQTIIDRLWITTQREAMIESGPPPATPPTPSAPASTSSAEKSAKPTPKQTGEPQP